MKKGMMRINAAVHDPDIFLDKNGDYYLFGTHMTSAKSNDLRNWEMLNFGVRPENTLFENLFDSKPGAFDYTEKFNGKYYAVWAPDVSYNPYLKKYVMYFCTSSSYIKSTIAMAAADKAEGPYTYVDTFLYSGFDEVTVKKTNLYEILGKDADIRTYFNKKDRYNNLAWPNCIDPNLFHDEEGRLWMVYGSWSGGIFILEIDEKTGYPIHPKQDIKAHIDTYYGKKLIGGGHKSIEGPYIMYDKKSDYYYLFISFGWLEREGGYQIRLFRSKKPDGPYVDMQGKSFGRVYHHEPYGLKLVGNYIFPSMEYAYKAPGHNSAFEDKDGRLYVVYHQRFDNGTEEHEPRVHQLLRTRNGWLTMCPFATDGEMLIDKSYHESEICGTYHIVIHGQDISAEVHSAVKFELDRNGKIYKYKDNGKDLYERPVGSYKLEDRSYISIEFEDVAYDSVIVNMTDEVGNQVMSITGVGNNQSMWAVKYL